jgi:acyl-CoA dehydrogenase family member 9
MQMSLMKSLIKGKLETELAFPYPEMTAEDAETMNMFIDSVEDFCKNNINGLQFDKEKHIPPEVLQGLGELGVMGITIPEEYGGSGLSPTVYNRVVGTIAKYCTSTAITIGAHQSIGYKPILLEGTEEQKQQWLPQCATGDEIAAFALTEANAGSDNTKIATKAVPNEDESVYTLNGTKLWITNGGFAKIFTVFARTKRGLTCFVIHKDDGGVSIGPPEDKLGLRASSTTEVHLENVKVPADRIIGKKGFKVAMDTLVHGRLGLAGSCYVLSNYCLELAQEQAGQREQFKHPIKDFGLIREKLANMAISTYIQDAMTYLAGEMYFQRGIDMSIEADISKCFCTEELWVNINEALQIAAGNGYMTEYPYERMLRDNRINQIFEGTNEIQRLIIGQTTLRLIREAVDEGTLDENHRLTLPNIHESLRPAIDHFEQMTHQLYNGFVRLYKTSGKDIFTNQYQMQRASDITSYIYALFAGICKTQYLIDQKGQDAVNPEIRITNAFADRALKATTAEYDTIFENQDSLIDHIVDDLYR